MLISLEKQLFDHVRILHMPWLMSCHDMCKTMTLLYNQNPYSNKKKTHEISIMSSQALWYGFQASYTSYLIYFQVQIQILDTCVVIKALNLNLIKIFQMSHIHSTPLHVYTTQRLEQYLYKPMLINRLKQQNSFRYQFQRSALEWSQIDINGGCRLTDNAGAIILVPCHVMKSLQLIRRLGPRRFIYGCLIFKWLAVTWFKGGAPG